MKHCLEICQMFTSSRYIYADLKIFNRSAKSHDKQVFVIYIIHSKPMKYAILSLLLILAMSACKDEETLDVNQLVINEVMSKNSITMPDQNGEYDDWIEIYNLSSEPIDMSGYFLTDDNDEFTKWKFPPKTVIKAQNYLIVWADGDTLQAGLHTNFKLSALGEKLILFSDKLEPVDKVSWEAQELELSFARIPNGTGEFEWVKASFAKVNTK